MPHEEILLEHHVRDGVDVVRFANPMIKDGMAVLLLDEELKQIMDSDRDGAPRVCIDFEPVEFIATTVLVRLISFHKKIKSRKGQLVLCGMQPTVADVFRVTSFDKFFTIEADQKAALKRLGG